MSAQGSSHGPLPALAIMALPLALAAALSAQPLPLLAHAFEVCPPMNEQLCLGRLLRPVEVRSFDTSVKARNLYTSFNDSYKEEPANSGEAWAHGSSRLTSDFWCRLGGTAPPQARPAAGCGLRVVGCGSHGTSGRRGRRNWGLCVSHNFTHLTLPLFTVHFVRLTTAHAPLDRFSLPPLLTTTPDFSALGTASQ